jgi:hypothetical protein
LNSLSLDLIDKEKKLEAAVSQYIGEMMLLWIDVPDEPNKKSDRSYIEMNAIALLSGKTGPIDIASRSWLGKFRNHQAILKSSLWNVNYVENEYDPQFLDVFSQYVEATIKQKPILTKSLAPSNWYEVLKKKEPYSQMSFLDGADNEP